MEKIKILVVDDESRMRKLIKDFLEREGYQILEAGDGLEALDVFYENKDIALMILDVMMPRMDGWAVCREVRQSSTMPIKILVARVTALLKRAKCVMPGDNIDAGGIEIDKAAHIVRIDGHEIDLSVKEFELLVYFVENQKIALTREKILNSVWNYDYFGDARTIDTHVKKLRSKLGEKGNYIKTIWGMGYKFEVE